MFNNQKCVAQITELSKRGEQTGIVSLVQPDGGFVKNIHDASKPAADLSCEADALTFAAREGVRFAVESEVVQADAVKEAQTILYFLDDFCSDEHASFVKWLKDVLVGFGGSVSFGIPSAHQA